jgi:hypothetical protein
MAADAPIYRKTGRWVGDEFEGGKRDARGADAGFFGKQEFEQEVTEETEGFCESRFRAACTACAMGLGRHRKKDGY